MLKDRLINSYTSIIILINVIAFVIYQLALNFTSDFLILYNFALIPQRIIESYNIWTIITSLFMHTIPMHLLFNMLTLFFIGKFVEPLIGRKRFLILFLGSGIFAAISHVIITLIGGGDSIYIPALGASGAIMGLLGILAILTPKQKVLLFFVVPMPIWGLGVILLLGVIFNPSIGGVLIGHVAHFAGFIFGVGYGLYLKKKYPRKTKMIARYFS